MTRAVYTNISDRSLKFLGAVSEFATLMMQIIRSVPLLWFYRRQVVEQLYSFSIKTLPITTFIAVFVGLEAMVQGIYQATGVIPRTIVINSIFKSCVLELCPVILALVLAGKLGASLAAELGAMKITEQIDALSTMSLEPVGFLVLPRVLAGAVMLPAMTIFANLIAMLSAFVGSCVITHWALPQEFFEGLTSGFKSFEIIFGSIIKPTVFGAIIATVGSFFGLRTSGGAKGVGEAATGAVVVAAMLIIIFDYYLGELLL
jgi:phospholipid/cholesterol/gamma-HCH transport system permease protein